jgi:hypothetical protein
MWSTLTHIRRNAIAYLALFLALGGSSYAALRLPANSVGTKQLKDAAVTLTKISSSAQVALHGMQGPKGDPGPGAAGFDAAVPEDGTYHQELANGDFALGVTCKPNDGGFAFDIVPVNPLGLESDGTFASLTNPNATTFLWGGNVNPGAHYSLLMSSAAPQRALGTALVHVGPKVYSITYSVAMSGACFARAQVVPTA